MAILVANIGTSDISVKIGDYYIPIGFDREERNLSTIGLNDAEKALWQNQRQTLIQTFAQEKLGIDPKSTFRDFTKQLLAEYDQTPEVWHPQIKVGRFWGALQSAINAAKKADLLKSVFLFVTDQKPEQHQDTIYASKIILKWLSIEAPDWFAGDHPQIQLHEQIISPKIAAIDEDGLIEEYYDFFQKFDRNEIAYISIRGGTPQMQSALRTQAISSTLKAQIILQPTLNVAEILQGKASECKRVAYWRYQQTQRYTAVRQLLDRWDFDGAVVLLESWKETLQSLIDSKVTDDKHELQDKRDAISQALIGLKVAIDCFSLDQESALKRFKHKKLDKTSELPFKATVENYDLLQNLYAQCKIYQESRQVPNFLARMGSFYEVSQSQLLKRQSGSKHLKTDHSGRLFVRTEELFNNDRDLWNKFLEIHRRCIEQKGWEDKKFQPGYRWNFEKFKELPLKDRFIRNSFLKALIEHQYGSRYDNRPKLALWSQFDFWYDRRNSVIHGSQGVNQDRMRQLPQQYPLEAKDACTYDQILTVMQDILSEVGISKSEDDYYIYSQIREWTLSRLK